MLGVVGVLAALDSPTRFCEVTDEVLLLEEVSKSASLSLLVSEGLVSNNFCRPTLKIESVGMLGVESSKPP